MQVSPNGPSSQGGNGLLGRGPELAAWLATRSTFADTVPQDALPLQRCYRWELERANRVFLTQPRGGDVREWTWSEAMEEVRRMAAYLIAQNWPTGSRIVIISRNCAWWMMAELAVWMAGHVSVPIYPSLSARSVRALVDHCEPVACFVGGLDDANVIEQAIPESVHCIRFPNAAPCKGRQWNEIALATPPLATSPVRAADDLATIIYTSGTTGTPKGVMHRFAAFTYFVAAVTRVFGESSEERMLSYLPLAHIAERALVESTSFYSGLQVYFVDSVETFRADLQRARPTIFFSVPRLFIKFQQAVLARIPQSRLDRMLHTPVLNRFVRARILKQLGLSSVRMAASGGAPLPLGTLQWFRSIGLNLVEGYGMTETGITHTPPQGRSRPGYVGDGVPRVETKIDSNGEILVRSPMNMMGYYKDPEGTRNAFTDDGFFRTGDLGELDAEGWLKIIGRAKEQFKTSKGKYVSPATIEKLLCTDPRIESCCVAGAGLPKAFAIVLLSQDVRNAIVDSPQAKTECDEALRRLLDRVNQQLEAHERLSCLVVTNEPWTVSNGFLTPTMKLKRSALEQVYTKYFEEWCREGKAVVWHSSRATTG
jgi:long-chain acyl-CoA synthetase